MIKGVEFPQLTAKLRTYAEYAMSGALARQYPELADSLVEIRLQPNTLLIPTRATSRR